MIIKQLKEWTKGVRLYIALAAVLIAAEVWWWATAVYGSSNLATIRMQEVYAWLALGLMTVAVFIGPTLKLFPKLPGKGLLRDARRMLGISGAGFAALHVGIAYIALFKLPNPTTLADSYQKAFLLGAVALVILLLMAFTSFDRAFHKMGIWWFRLHRLVYVALLLALLHAFMIGSHAVGWPALITVALAAVVLLAFHVILMLRHERPGNLQVITITYAVLFAAAVLNYGLSQHLGYNILLNSHKEDTHVEG